MTQPDETLFISVPAAGRRLYGIGPARSYQIAAQGLLPTIRLGRRLLVPVRALDALSDDAVARGRAIGEAALFR